MSDYTRLVEQARQAVDDLIAGGRIVSTDDVPGLLAGLADAVEQIQVERDFWSDGEADALALMHERDEARARVADLEAFVRKLASEDFRGNEPQHRRDARALLGSGKDDTDAR